MPQWPPRVRGLGNWKGKAGWLAIGALAIAGAGYAVTRKRVVKDVEFTVREVSSGGGSELMLRIRSEGLRFFESGSNAPPPAQRQYAGSFAAGASRYINVEVRFRNEPPGRELAVPMACDIFTSADQVFTSLAIHARIQPAWTESAYYNGWGTARGGWWKPGRYRVECKYGGKLIGRDWFDVVAGGAPGDPVPPPAPRPAPLVPPPPPARSGSEGILGSLDARVRSLRFFESGYGTMPLGERQYRDSFSAQETRFVNVELVMEHSAPSRTAAVALSCRYLRNETPVGTARMSLRIAPGSSRSTGSTGWGGRNPGSWEPGAYQVVCSEGPEALAAGQFRIR